MRSITFITGNAYKFQIAQKALEGKGIELVQQKLETPEIQSTDVAEIASFSAQWASKELDRPVVLTDAGYFIEALNGFPGPFIKYINQWLTARDILKLMDGKTNRTVVVKACLAYCELNKEPVTFLSEAHGTISLEAGKTEKGYVTPISEVFIPEGFDRVEAQLTKEEAVGFWAKMESHWSLLATYLDERRL